MGDNKLIRRRLANSYLSSIISISLVLILIGTAAFLLVNAGSVSNYFKENMQVNVMLKQGVDEEQAGSYCERLSRLPYVKTTSVISREQGTRELQEMLGEDFLDVFENSPVPVSVDVTLKAEYVSADSLDFVLPAIGDSELVDEVSCQESLVSALNSNLRKVSLVLGVFIFLLLFISFVLINNTVRLNVFAKRFSIHTMRLVGATKSFIRAPFLVSSIWQGLASAGLAVGALAGIFYAMKGSFPAFFKLFDPSLQLIVAGIIIVCGVLICLVCTFFVVNKLVSLTKEELYS